MRRNKFGAKPVHGVDGYFASLKEHRRWQELKLLERAKEITQLVRQPRFPITFNGFKICDYVADAAYYEKGKYVVEDTKSVATRTPVYRIKRKLVQAQYGIEVRET